MCDLVSLSVHPSSVRSFIHSSLNTLLTIKISHSTSFRHNNKSFVLSIIFVLTLFDDFVGNFSLSELPVREVTLRSVVALWRSHSLLSLALILLCLLEFVVNFTFGVVFLQYSGFLFECCVDRCLSSTCCSTRFFFDCFFCVVNCHILRSGIQFALVFSYCTVLVLLMIRLHHSFQNQTNQLAL